MIDEHPIRVALVGNPNAGKTTIFNQLTGMHQHVGNYPGVTVEKKEGFFTHRGRLFHVTDLPGIYCLTASSLEERVARRHLIEDRPDLVLDVLDASNLERNLYLTTQLMELGAPLLLAFNMSDRAESRGYHVNAERLSRLLNLPILRTVGHRGKGIEELKDAIHEQASATNTPPPTTITYGRDLEDDLAKIEPIMAKIPEIPKHVPARWLAIKLIESDDDARAMLPPPPVDLKELNTAVEAAKRHIQHDSREAPEVVLAGRRYGFISGACQESVTITAEVRHRTSDFVDRVLVHPVMGLPIFAGILYIMFKLIFSVGGILTALFERAFLELGKLISGLWPAGSETLLQSLVVDGVIGGVGSVLIFLPNIMLLFMAIALLEDSGYMARAAFVTDRLMHKVGLHGKSFIPLVMGFGCTVPAMMATRILDCPRNRLATLFVLPLMSCGARLPIYILFTTAFFPEAWQTPILWGLYLTGVIFAMIVLRLLRSTFLAGDTTDFVMELPPYHLPTFRGVLTHTWERAWQFIKRAGTIIAAFSILFWALTSFPMLPTHDHAGLSVENLHERQVEHSYAGRLGRALEPVLRPVGFDWKTSTSLIAAIAGKELFVAQLGVMHAVGQADDSQDSFRIVLRREYTPLQAMAIMIFCLLSMPCMSTSITMWRETGRMLWAIIQLAGLTLLAYGATLIVYQGGLWLGLGAR